MNNTHTFNAGERRWLGDRRCLYEQESAEARTGISGSALRGSIIKIRSVNAILAIPTIASYNISKGGINQLTRAMALADKGIRVNAVAAGTIAKALAAKAVLTRMKRTPKHESHADEASRVAVGDRRHRDLFDERSRKLHHRRNCVC